MAASSFLPSSLCLRLRPVGPLGRPSGAEGATPAPGGRLETSTPETKQHSARGIMPKRVALLGSAPPCVQPHSPVTETEIATVRANCGSSIPPRTTRSHLQPHRVTDVKQVGTKTLAGQSNTDLVIAPVSIERGLSVLECGLLTGDMTLESGSPIRAIAGGELTASIYAATHAKRG